MEDIDFLFLRNFKLLRKIKINPVNIFDLVFKLVISFIGGHFGYTAWESKTELSWKKPFEIWNIARRCNILGSHSRGIRNRVCNATCILRMKHQV
jgi:hypothetical protein